MLDKLQQLYNTYAHVDDSDEAWGWLSKLNASQAFLACLGAGPWKEKRRKTVQSAALTALGNFDLAEDVPIPFPLKWQNDKLAALRASLQQQRRYMSAFCERLMSTPTLARKRLYAVTESRGRAKVLDLFCRDYLKVPSFPIDRHVARILDDAGIKKNEDQLVKSCLEAGIDPRKLARRLVGHTVSNPDLSEFRL